MIEEPVSPLVLVSGGLSGIGAAVAEKIEREGGRVIVVDIAASESKSFGPEVWRESVDVSSESSVEDAVAKIESSYGPIYGLVNAAGVLGKMHPPHKLRMSDWDRELSVDYRGTYLMCRAVGTRMIQRRSGSIVNVASVAGMTSGPVHGYGPAKAAVISLTTTLAAEWGPLNVRVNAVSPGFTSTPALRKGIEAGVLMQETLVRLSALQRLVEPSEVASAITWLLGEGSSGITGANIPVDAGFLVGVTWEAYGGLRRSDPT